jgi:hypothetical protein
MTISPFHIVVKRIGRSGVRESPVLNTFSSACLTKHFVVHTTFGVSLSASIVANDWITISRLKELLKIVGIPRKSQIGSIVEVIVKVDELIKNASLCGVNVKQLLSALRRDWNTRRSALEDRWHDSLGTMRDEVSDDEFKMSIVKSRRILRRLKQADALTNPY